MNKFRFFSVAVIFTSLLSSAAFAAPLGFNGYYDYATWSSSETYGGATVSSIDGPQQVLTLKEPDSYPATPFTSQEFKFSHTVLNLGLLSFNWSFDANIDACCSGLNFYVNSTLYNLIGGYFGNSYKWDGAIGSGSFSTFVNAGDTITFGAFSADSCCGATTNVISNFDAPVPEPTSLALLGLALAGLAGTRRSKKVA